MSGPLILWFEEIGLGDEGRVGRKCLSLARLSRTGLPTPPGFALTIQAGELMMEATGVGEAASRYLSRFDQGALANFGFAEEAGAHLLQLMKMVELPEEIRRALEQGYDRLCRLSGREEAAVAVRSSGPVSRPGLFATFLNVRGLDELEKRVRDCWASAYAPRALAMRAQRGWPVDREPLGVVVCRMIEARSAGVLFTAHPVSGHRGQAVLEASWGLGESVVQAAVTPDRFIVDKASLKIVERVINPKPSQVSLARRGTKIEPVPLKRQAAASLSEAEVKELVRLGQEVEALFDGLAQDIEWAVAEGAPFPQSIFLLQSRPIIGFEAGPRSIDKPEGLSEAEHIAELTVERLFE